MNLERLRLEPGERIEIVTAHGTFTVLVDATVSTVSATPGSGMTLSDRGYATLHLHQTRREGFD